MKKAANLIYGLAIVIAGAWLYDTYLKGRELPYPGKANG